MPQASCTHCSVDWGDIVMLGFWKKRDAALEERTRLYREEGMRRADQLMTATKGVLLRECFVDPELGA